MIVTPLDVYRMALRALPKVEAKYPVANRLKLARVMIPLVKRESTFNTEAVPAQKTSSGWAKGLTQVTEGTMRDIEKRMGWEERSYSARTDDPQYAIDLGVAHLAWLLSRNKADFKRALYHYNQGPYAKYSSKSYGEKYSTSILNDYDTYDFAALEQRLEPSVASTLIHLRGEFF